jgi:hypothetical protein
MNSNTVFSSGAVRASGGKSRIALISPHLFNETAKVLTFGAEKYSERNWEKGFPWSDTYSALQRHLNAWWAGEELEPESGLHHLGFAACNVMFLLHFALEGTGEDDRCPLKQILNFIAKPEEMTWPQKDRRDKASSSNWKPVRILKSSDSEDREVLWKANNEAREQVIFRYYSSNAEDNLVPDYGFYCEIPE